MATLTIRNVDERVYERLKARAKANHRSLEAEARLALSGPSPAGDWVEDMRQFHEDMRAKYGRLPDSTAIIRQMRDEE